MTSYGSGRLAALDDAATRARERSWHAASQLSEAKAELQRVTADEPRRLAYSFVNSDEAANPIGEARAYVEACQTEVAKVAEIEAALASEIVRAQSEAQRLRERRGQAMADTVCGSAEYHALIAEHRAAWAHLRTLKAALVAVRSALHGQAPQSLYFEIDSREPLEADRVGFPVDGAFVAAWSAALAVLESNPSAPLPNGG
jgi:hypothetical protein